MMPSMFSPLSIESGTLAGSKKPPAWVPLNSLPPNHRRVYDDDDANVLASPHGVQGVGTRHERRLAGRDEDHPRTVDDFIDRSPAIVNL